MRSPIDSTLSLHSTLSYYYSDSTNKIQPIEVWNDKNHSLEKTICSQQRIISEATSVFGEIFSRLNFKVS